MRSLILLLVLLTFGCGYHVPDASDTWVGGEARSVYVRLFVNKTSEPYLENFMTDALIAELSRSRVIELTENRDSAELHLVGSVENFNSRSIAYSSTDRITDYRATMNISVRLLETGKNKVIWKDKLRQTEDYLATVDKSLQLEGQRQAARRVASRLAEDIHAHLLNSF